MHFPARYIRATCLVFIITAVAMLPVKAHGTAAPPVQPRHSEPFPVYDVIKPNVSFWIDMFTRYSKSQGIVHDLVDLSRIYGIVRLDPAKTRAAAAKNRKAKEKAIQTYRQILLNLAKGRHPATPLEKKTATLFGKNPSPARLKQAACRLRIQTGLKEQFKQGIVRSGALIDKFRQIFKEYGLPEDLVFLPCVESSFDTSAYSKFGAAGIWQFTRGTGKLFMNIGYVVDERRDPLIATHGAAQLLKRNVEALKSWPLAITAYNHGLAGMQRAKKKHATYPAIFSSYKSRSFKFASKNFYSEFLAARHVAKNHVRYYGDITLDRPVDVHRYTTQGFVPARELAQHLELDIHILKTLNPALRPPVFDGRKFIPKGYPLKLPQRMSREQVNQALSALYRQRQNPSRFHQVQKGDTAGLISKTHHVSLSDLIAANNLDRRATIYIGQTLRIPPIGQPAPPAAGVAKAAVHAPALTPRPELTPKTKPDPAPKQPEDPTPRQSTGPRPVPKAPENQELSNQETLTQEPVQTAAAPIAPGMDLSVVTADLKIQKILPADSGSVGIIHAAAGETLGHYADWLDIATRTLRKMNRLPYGQAIVLGQTIRLPLPLEGAAVFEEKRYEFHQETLEDFFDSFFVAGTRKYKIKAGDTIWQLCQDELEIPLWLLKKFNPAMNMSRLSPGQTLVYPLINPNSGNILNSDTGAGPACDTGT